MKSYYEEDNEYFKGLVEAYSTAKDDEKLKDIILNLYKFSMSGPWPESWLIEKAEEFNINTLEELDKTKWVEILKDNIRVEVEGFINMYHKAIEIISDTEGLEAIFRYFQRMT